MKTPIRILFAVTVAALSCSAQTTPPRLAIHNEPVTRDTPNSDDYYVIDGATGGTAKSHANLAVRTNGSYADPSWIPSFSWSKIIGPPTTLAGYGITDAQPLNASNLTKLAALSGTNVLYYRDGSGNWTAVTIGSNLTFSGGTLSATGGGGSGDMLKSVYDTNADNIVDHAALADAAPWSGISSKPTSAAAAGFTNGATIDAWGAKTVPTGTIADLTSAQTISGKSIDAAQLTGTVNAARLPASGVTAATYGDSTHVAQVAIDATGRVTSASSVAIASGGSGTVTSVAATVPSFLSVSGTPITGAGTLAISYSGTPLPVANGGTGTTTPGIVAGTNVTVTGTWPNQTVNATGGGGGLPSQTGNAGKIIATDGSSARWDTGLNYGVYAAAQQNFVWEGDSLTANIDVGFNADAPDWTQRAMLLPWFAGHVTRSDFAFSGNQLSQLVARYTSSVHPLRPTGSILSAWFCPWVGANDIGDTSQTASGWETSWASYIDGALADGFKVIAFTIMSRGDVDSTAEAKRQAINTYIRSQVTRWTILIDVDQLFPDNSDTTWFLSDHVHLSGQGRQRLAQYVNGKLSGVDGVPLPPSTNATGTGDSQVPTNLILKTTARAYTAAQGFTPVVLTDASSITWNGDAAQVAKLNLGGNHQLANITSPRAGFTYFLEVINGGSNTLTYGTNYKWPGGTVPTITAGPSKADTLSFYYDGTYLLGRVLAQNYDVSVPVVTTMQENANPTGSDQDMNGTHPDTSDVPNHTWTAYNTTFTRTNATGVITSGGNGALLYDGGLTSYTYQGVVYPDVFNNGIAFRGVDGDNYWSMYNGGSGAISIYSHVAGSNDLKGTYSYTPNSSTGNVFKVVVTPTTIAVYVDGTLLGTITDSTNGTATKVGVGGFTVCRYDSLQLQ